MRSTSATWSRGVSYKSKQNKPRPKDQWIRVEHTHEAIIDQDLWERVQALISEKTKPFTGGSIGLFAKKVRCANCGYTMRSTKNRGRHYLQCSNRRVSKEACTGAFISVEKLERIVVQELNRLSAQYLDQDKLERNLEFSSSLLAQRQKVLDQRSKYQAQHEEFQTGLRELYLDKVRGILSESDFLSLSQDFSKEKELLEGKIAETNRRLEELDARIAAGDNRRELVQRYTNLEHLTREMVEALIDYILVGKRQPGENDPPVEIHWNF